MLKTPDPKPPTPDPASDTAFARAVLDAEAAAIARIEPDQSFEKAVDLLLNLTGAGSLVVSGIGKSGLIGAKLSATFSSTGTPSHFLHPSEAMHGDLGRVRRGDAVLILSYGGNTDEVVALASILRQDSVPVIAIVGKPECDLGRLATLTLCIGDITEACPHNLAPTASTAAMLALGDALALAVSRRRGFGAEDFHKFHPGGGLGRQLTPVTEAMRFVAVGEQANLPLISGGDTVEQAYAEATRVAETRGIRRAGALVIVDDAGQLAGIFTDGDLRRLVFEDRAALSRPIGEVMTKNPRTLRDTAQVRDAVRIMRERRIDELPVVDEAGKPVGLIDVQDLVALKVVEG